MLRIIGEEIGALISVGAFIAMLAVVAIAFGA